MNFQEKRKQGTISYLQKVLSDMEKRGWEKEAKSVKKQIKYVEKYGYLPVER